MKQSCHLGQWGSGALRSAVGDREGVDRPVAVDVFLDSLGDPHTVRNYGVGVGKAAERLGENRPLASVADEMLGEAREVLWGSTAVNTWNTHRAAVLSWPGWCRDHGHEGPAVPAWPKRPAVPDAETPVRSKMAVGRLIAGREVHVREKELRRMLYETTPVRRRSSASASRSWTWPARPRT